MVRSALPRLTSAFRALAVSALLVLGACNKVDPIGADLVALNNAGQAAMASANVNQAMAKVQEARTPAEKAAVLRESAQAISRAQADLTKLEIKSTEVRSIHDKMVGGFGKLAGGAKGAADAFEASSAADLEKARQQMREGQLEFLAAGQDMVVLAKARSVSLAPKS